MINTSAITTVTRASMKPRSGATANRHLFVCRSGERNREKRRTKETFCRTMIRALGAAEVGKKAHLRTKQHRIVKKSSP